MNREKLKDVLNKHTCMAGFEVEEVLNEYFPEPVTLRNMKVGVLYKSAFGHFFEVVILSDGIRYFLNRSAGKFYTEDGLVSSDIYTEVKK